MLFNKNKNKMIDIRELQKRGVVRIPKERINIPTNNDGFIELGTHSNPKSGPSRVMSAENQIPNTKSPSSNADFFGFMENTTPETPNAGLTRVMSAEDRTTETPNEHARLTDLDNKIYKLEQRIELLEKKLDVNQQSNKVGPMGW